ncbi:MAG TPA: ABC transporter permease [Thermoplasmata archaeon]|nr:ABC transporter permease [Thermoplasmata archaeon]
MSVATVRRTDLRYRIGLNLRAVVGRSYPRIVGANREPSWIFFEALLPLLGIAAYVFIYQSFGARALAGIASDPSLVNYPIDPWAVIFLHKSPAELRAGVMQGAIATAQANTNALVASVVLGGTMVAFWLNVLWSMASQLYWEKEIGNLQLYMMAPMNRMALLGGMAVGGMVMTSMRAVSTLIAGVFVFGVIFQVANPFLLIAVFFATLIALYGLGMMFASLYLLWGREAWNLSALMEEPIFFSSGFYFPLGGLFRIPGWGPAVAIAGSFIPASIGLDALRQLTLGSTAFGGTLWIFDVTTELEILVGMAVLFLILARYALAYLETLAKREGKLTSRHQ